MDPEAPWKELEAAALLGTERKAFAPSAIAGHLGRVTGDLAGREPEKVLLGTAAALALVRRAGRSFGAEPEPLPDPAADDPRPRASAAHLAVLLATPGYADLLPEWLEALARSGRRPPEEYLSDLLDRARKAEYLRPAILAAVGERGRWLARRNPEWSFVEASVAADTADPDALWETGTFEQRNTLLRRMRAADPDRGRELVASTWGVDGPLERAAFLVLFEAGLSPADEPLLEAALDDRRKEVRMAAADLLQRLPGSALIRRMRERAAPLLGLDGIDPPRSGKPPFGTVEPPAACDKAMIRDGIEAKSQLHNVGERAWWLREIVERIPPSFWSAAWGLPAADLVAAALANKKWGGILYPALAEAAMRFGDTEWIEAALPHCRLTRSTHTPAELIAFLPADRRAAAALAMLRADGRAATEAIPDELLDVLENVPGPWGGEFAAEVLARLPANLRAARAYDYALSQFLKVAAAALPAAAALEAFGGGVVREGDLPTAHRDFEPFLATLHFRVDMTKELSA